MKARETGGNHLHQQRAGRRRKRERKKEIKTKVYSKGYPFGTRKIAET